MSEEQGYIGVNPTGRKRGVAYVILDKALHVLKVNSDDPEAIVEVIDRYPRAVCAIAAPIGPNKGLLTTSDYRQRLGLPPDKATYANYRVCEYELRRRGIGLRGTPQEMKRVPRWMQASQKLFDGLRTKGFVEHPRPGPRQICEVHPPSGFAVLIGKRPYPKRSVEGRLQRQLALFEEGVELPDPMLILQELTRHRLMTGQVNLTGLYDHLLLGAFMGAYTAFLVGSEPHNVTTVGDPAEALIVLPTAELKEWYE